MSSPTPEPASGHPLAVFATRLLDRLDDLTAASARPVWAMSEAELRQVLVDLAVGGTQLEALRLEVLAEADRRGATGAEAMASAAEWVAVETRQRRTHARADLHLARSLETHPHLAAGMASGSVNTDQARVIVRALDRLPTTGEFAVDPQQHAEAEEHLVALATVHDAKALEVLGRRIFEVVASDLAEAYEGRLLEAQEAAAARKTSFTMHETPDGLVRGRFALPVLHGAILHKAITGLASPVRGDGQVIDPDLPAPVRHGIAFTELLEALPADPLPAVAGGDITIVVTMRHDQLLADLDAAGVATLDTGHRISAGEARRLACAHRIVPAVLDGASVPLDLGRPDACTPRPNAWRWPNATGAAPRAGATDHPPGAKPTTTTPGPPAAAPTSPRAGSCAATTTAASTTPPSTTTPAPTAPSSSTDASEPPRSTSSHPHVDRRSSPGRRGPDPTPLTQVTPACGVHSPHVERPTPTGTTVHEHDATSIGGARLDEGWPGGANERSRGPPGLDPRSARGLSHDPVRVSGRPHGAQQRQPGTGIVVDE